MTCSYNIGSYASSCILKTALSVYNYESSLYIYMPNYTISVKCLGTVLLSVLELLSSVLEAYSKHP